MNLLTENPWLYGFLCWIIAAIAIVIIRWIGFLEEESEREHEYRMQCLLWHNSESDDFVADGGSAGFPVLTEEIPRNTPLDNTARPQ